MKNNKILILFPDGVGLRNFAFTKFNQISEEQGFEIVYWNNTIFDLTKLGFKECRLKAKSHWFSDILKTAKIDIGLSLFSKRTNDKVYDTYRFPYSFNNFGNILKTILVKIVVFAFCSEKGFKKITYFINKLERKTNYYKQCIETLEKEKPAFVFSTNQRSIVSIAPLLVAKELKIPTATFIFSWDNIPKAILLVEADYYFVWSNYMKTELLFYYPEIKENQVFVTGTPQFEPHFDTTLLIDKKTFFDNHKLDLNKKYITFTGDDTTTSPNDHLYLEDLAIAIEKCNDNRHNFGIIFRRCPVDISKRYDNVINKYKNLISVIDPLWKPYTTAWNTILPTKEDFAMLSNLAEHSEMLVNIGSSTVFDFVSHNKPCGYFNYNQTIQTNHKWDIFTLYRFVHFRSMPCKEAVVWFDNKEELVVKIQETLQNPENIIKNAKNWFETINISNPKDASSKFWESIILILNKK
jgi:hypothetical protein